MKILIDENMSSPRLSLPLRAQGHDPVLAPDVGLLSVSDARVLICSISQTMPVLTRDSEDFEDLHDLVMAAAGHHAGILIVRFEGTKGPGTVLDLQACNSSRTLRSNPEVSPAASETSHSPRSVARPRIPCYA